ncbi:glycoside hydrolase [Flavicella sp.]|uniref:glycoside hydrolase n=1 Tax=Flavicella sp. TaxID=2957742 RepID=UPI00301ABE74
MKKFSLLFTLLISFNASSQDIETIKINIDTTIEYQTIHNFGASDAWSTQFVGNWTVIKKNQIADLLFSLEVDINGTPYGIGLSSWRFNIGAGSAEQEEKSDIKDEWRRSECFLNSDNSYNWDKHIGQQWFLNAAKERGTRDFVGFVNSPPILFTKNGKAYSNDGLTSNLKEESYLDYAVFLKDVTNYFSNKYQIDFKYISPFNEPQWEWKNNNQEGSPWNNSELKNATRIIDSIFIANNLQTKIEITEAGAADYLTGEKEKFKNRSNQIEEFFNPNSNNFIGNLKSVAPKIVGHSYFTTWNVQKLKNEREKIAKKLQKYPNLEYWMTEYCVLENNEEIKGKGKGLGMKTALYVARVIHSDLTIANASSWYWWLAMSPYNYKDGLIYIDKNKEDGSFQESKLLWSLGNYSRFIRPKAKRIKVDYNGYNSIDNLSNGVLISAFENSDDSLVIVLVNQKNDEIFIDLESVKYDSIKLYITNKINNLELQKINLNKKIIKLTANSVNTIVFE